MKGETELEPGQSLIDKLINLGIMGIALQLPFWGYALGVFETNQHRHSVANNRIARLSISPEFADVGDVPINSEYSGQVQIKNLGTEILSLATPEPDCGCIQATIRKAELTPGEETTLEFQYRAPVEPGEIQRTIRIRESEGGSGVWEIPIRGRAVADFWADPPLLKGEIGESGTIELPVKLRSAKGWKLTGLESADSRIEASRSGDGEPEELYQAVVRVHDRASGKGVVVGRFESNAGEKRDVAIPVEWEPRREFRIVPGELLIRKQRSGRKSILGIMIVSRGELTERVPKIETRISWMKIGAVTKLSSGKLRVEVVADVGKMPSEFRGEGIVVRYHEGASGELALPVRVIQE